MIDRPSHGYELSQRYERAFGSMQRLSVPGVYRALERLSAAAMIELVDQAGKGARRRQQALRRTFQATHKGVESYGEWVSHNLCDEREGPVLLAQIAAAALLGPDTLLRAIGVFERRLTEELERLPVPHAQGPQDVQELVAELLLDERRRELCARLDWARHAREQVRARAGHMWRGVAHRRRSPR